VSIERGTGSRPGTLRGGRGTRQRVATPVPHRNPARWLFKRASIALSTRRDQRGFTLIELLVVIIVLGLLVGLVGPRLFGRVGQSKQAAARAQIELLGAGLDQYRLDVGSYPNSGQGLDALQRNPNAPNWNGPYLKKAVPKDPWGQVYKYRCCPGQNGEYDLWSEGADAAPGGEGENADVVSWDTGQK
jgi:general secretion pathway protein G